MVRGKGQKTLADKMVVVGDAEVPNGGFGGIVGKLVEVQGENMPGNEDAPMVTVTGEVKDGWYTVDIEREIRTSIPTVDSGAAVSGLGSILFSMPTDGFLFTGPLPPLRPPPLGISVVTSLVKFGVFLTLLYEAMNSSSCLLYSAAATV